MERRFDHGEIQTYSGLAYNFAVPDPASIRLDDIAHALANACRYAGHTNRFYSVAEHSVRVSEILERWERAQGISSSVPAYGLLHDGHEAYVWDCPRPFKPLLGNVYRQFADKADAAIITALFPHTSRGAFHLPIIKKADSVALVAEARELMHYGPEAWVDWDDLYSKVPAPPEGTFPADCLGWPPDLAEEAFHARAKEVGLV